MKPTGVQIVSLRANDARAGYSETGRDAYTIRADRTYQVECQSRGSRPSATIEWYLLKKNQRYDIVADGGVQKLQQQQPAGGVSTTPVATILEATITGTVHTQQVSDVIFIEIILD